jgi:hypothetical protein
MAYSHQKTSIAELKGLSNGRGCRALMFPEAQNSVCAIRDSRRLFSSVGTAPANLNTRPAIRETRSDRAM